MITGFTEETKPLSIIEDTLIAEVIARGLSKKIGKENSVTSKKIIDGVNSFPHVKEVGYTLTGPRLRAIINVLRRTDAFRGIGVLISNNGGYWISTDKEEIVQYIKSLREREGAIAAMRASIEQQLNQLK